MSQTRQFISLDQAQAPFFVGLDLGGTNIKVGVVDDSGRPLSWLSIPTDPDKGPEDAACCPGELATLAWAIGDGGALDTVAVATPT